MRTETVPVTGMQAGLRLWRPLMQSASGKGGPLLRSILSVTPRHQFVQPSDFVIGDAAEDIGQPSLGIDAVQLGGLDQRIGDGG